MENLRLFNSLININRQTINFVKANSFINFKKVNLNEIKHKMNKIEFMIVLKIILSVYKPIYNFITFKYFKVYRNLIIRLYLYFYDVIPTLFISYN